MRRDKQRSRSVCALWCSSCCMLLQCADTSPDLHCWFVTSVIACGPILPPKPWLGHIRQHSSEAQSAEPSIAEAPKLYCSITDHPLIVIAKAIFSVCKHVHYLNHHQMFECSLAVQQYHVTVFVLQPSTRQLPEDQAGPLANVSLAQAHGNKMLRYLDAPLCNLHIATSTQPPRQLG